MYDDLWQGGQIIYTCLQGPLFANSISYCSAQQYWMPRRTGIKELVKLVKSVICDFCKCTCNRSWVSHTMSYYERNVMSMMSDDNWGGGDCDDVRTDDDADNDDNNQMIMKIMRIIVVGMVEWYKRKLWGLWRRLQTMRKD